MHEEALGQGIAFYGFGFAPVGQHRGSVHVLDFAIPARDATMS